MWALCDPALAAKSRRGDTQGPEGAPVGHPQPYTIRKSALTLGDQVEEIEELGEADGGGFGALDEGFTLGAESGNAEGHGDAVVAAGVDGGAVEGLAAGNVEAVFEFRYFSAHGAQILYNQGDAVGFLDAEFPGVADADAAAGVGGDGCKHRELVDELGGESATDFCRSEALRRGGDLDGADQFGILLLKIEDGYAGAEGGEDVEQSGAGGVKSQRIKHQAGAGEDGRGAEKEGGGGDVAGDGSRDGVEGLRAGDGDGVESAGERGAEGAEGQLAVVAGADGLSNRCGSSGLEAGEEDAGFYLGAGNGRGVANGLERVAVDG